MALVKKLTLIFLLMNSGVTHAFAQEVDSFAIFEKRYGPTPWILLGGASSTTLAYLARKDRSFRKRQNFADARPLGDFGVIGDVIGYGLLNGSYTLFMGWRGWSDGDIEARRNAELMARASVYTLATTTLLKNIINEKRPGYPDDNQSFPSGHAAASFAFASVVAARHGWGWGGISYALAGFIMISRVNDDFHYLHDVLAGATIGAAYAWGLHHSLSRDNDYWFTVLPSKNGGVAAFTLNF